MAGVPSQWIRTQCRPSTLLLTSSCWLKRARYAALLFRRTSKRSFGRAAGRCEFSGCNCNLIGDLLTGKDDLNRAYIAHIVSDAPKGPRGDEILSPQLSTDPSNLMLLCDTHHRLIDGASTWREYPVELLMRMKAEHEDRIDAVTAIARDRGSHVIRFAAGIGKNESPVNSDAVKEALIPEFYPVRNGMIDLDVPDLGIPDSDPSYWPLHQRLLREKYQERVKGRLERNEIGRLAVFGLAPMPLLIELGRLISDISEAHDRQLLREPKGWTWMPEPGQMELGREEPASHGSMVALKLGVSGPIDDERITAVLGGDASIWSLSAKGANNDILRTPSDLALWRRELRAVFESIKDKYGHVDMIHVFPAIPVSAAVELGRSGCRKLICRCASTTITGRLAASVQRSTSFIKHRSRQMKYTDPVLREIVAFSPLDVLLADIAVRIQLTATDHRLAVGHYHAIHQWLEREGSPLSGLIESFYAQGGFSIGATTARHAEDADFDIDAMVQVTMHPDTDPEHVLSTLLTAIRGERGTRYYDKTERKSRCVTVKYDGMHLDVTPAVVIPSLKERTSFIFHSKKTAAGFDKARLVANPWGFADWFLRQTPPEAAFGQFFERQSLDYERLRVRKPTRKQIQCRIRILPIASLVP